MPTIVPAVPIRIPMHATTDGKIKLGPQPSVVERSRLHVNVRDPITQTAKLAASRCIDERHGAWPVACLADSMRTCSIKQVASDDANATVRARKRRIQGASIRCKAKTANVFFRSNMQASRPLAASTFTADLGSEPGEGRKPYQWNQATVAWRHSAETARHHPYSASIAYVRSSCCNRQPIAFQISTGPVCTVPDEKHACGDKRGTFDEATDRTAPAPP